MLYFLFTAPPPPDIGFSYDAKENSRFIRLPEVLEEKSINKVFSVYKGFIYSLNRLEFKSLDGKKIQDIRSVESHIYKKLDYFLNGPTLIQTIINVVLFIISIGFYNPFKIMERKEEEFAEGLNASDVKDLHSRFEDHFQNNIQQTIHPKAKYVQDTLDKLEEDREDCPDAEFGRLCKKYPCIQEDLFAIKNPYLNPYLNPYPLKLSAKQQLAFAKAIELREELKDTHYVFTHGQNTRMLLVNMLARKLKRKYEPNQCEYFQVLRHDVYTRKVPEERNVKWYKTMLSPYSKIWYNPKKTYKDDAHYRELLCCDALLKSTVPYSSALSFLAGSTNLAIRENDQFVDNVLRSIVEQYILNQEVVERFLEEIVLLINRTLEEGKIEGSLYSICIPKELFHEVGYVSKARGVPYNTVPPRCLENLQKGELIKLEDRIPQIRLLTHLLSPEKNIHIIPYYAALSEDIDELEGDFSLLLECALLNFKFIPPKKEKKEDAPFVGEGLYGLVRKATGALGGFVRP